VSDKHFKKETTHVKQSNGKYLQQDIKLTPGTRSIFCENLWNCRPINLKRLTLSSAIYEPDFILSKGIPWKVRKDPFSNKKAYEGIYDFIDILGNDPSITPHQLCHGHPSYRFLSEATTPVNLDLELPILEYHLKSANKTVMIPEDT
jgi:hypothetical protein